MTKRKHISNQLGKNFKDLMDSLDSADDRVVVIVVAAYINDLILFRVENYLVDSPDVQSDLFNPTSGAISSYGALVDLAIVLGLIPIEIREWLKLVGHLRNNFAHKWGADTFSALEKSDEKRTQKSLAKLREFTYPPSMSWTKSYTLKDNFTVLQTAIFAVLNESLITDRLPAKVLDVSKYAELPYLHATLEKVLDRLS